MALTTADAAEAGREVLASGRLCAQARYAGTGHQPWWAQRASVTSAAFAADMAALSEMRIDYMFYGLTALASVAGM